MSTKLNPVYLDLFKKRIDSKIDLDRESEEILMNIGMAQKEGDFLNVTELMQNKDIASPATVHKRMKELSAMGLITVKPIKGQYPRKKVSLSGKGVQLINRYGKYAETAVQEHTQSS